MENSKKGKAGKLIIAIAAIAVIIAVIFGIKALIPEKAPNNDKAAKAAPEVIALPDEDVTDVTAITGTKKDKKGIVDKEGHKIYDTGYTNKYGAKIYTTGKKDADGNVLYTLNRTNDVGNLIYYTGKVSGDKLEIKRTNAVPDYKTNKNSKLTNGTRFTTTSTIKYKADKKEQEPAKAVSDSWITFSGGTKEDKFDKIIAIDDGYAAIGAGNSKDGIFAKAGASWKDYFASVSKLSKDGKIEWTYLTGGDGMVMFYDIAELKDGSIVAVGNTMATDTTAPKNALAVSSLIVKLDKKGKEVWSYSFPCSEEENGDMAYSIAATPDGGFVVGGLADSTTGLFKNADGKYKAYIIKFDKKGTVEWKKILSGSKSNKISALAVNEKGDIFATCVTHSYDGSFASLAEYKVNSNNPNTVVLKLNKKGDLKWSKNLAGWGRSEYNSVAATPDGGCVVGGVMSILKRANGSYTACYGSTDGYVVRFSDDGEVYWARNIGGSEADSIEEVIVTDKGIVVVGTTKSNNFTFSGLIASGKADGFITVIDNSGSVIFSNLIGGSEDDHIASVAPSEKGIVICGYTTSSDGIFKDSKANQKVEAFAAAYDFSDK